MQEQTQPTQGQGGQQTGGQFTQGSQATMGQPGTFGGSTGEMGSQTELAGQGTQQPGAGGQQGGQLGQGGGVGQQMGLALQDVETREQRIAVDDISRAIQVCGWCADQCIQSADPNMIECIRLCEDVAELGEAALALVPRNSRFLQPVLQAFEQAAQACAQECGQHSHAHCQECAQVLPQATQSVQQFVGSWGQQQSGY